MTDHLTLGDVPHCNVADLPRLLADATTPVVVEASTDWCYPCQLLRPIMLKIAYEFAGRLAVVQVNGEDCNDLPFRAETFPTLMFFCDGKLVHTLQGTSNPAQVQAAVLGVLGLPTDTAASPSEIAYRQAQEQALASADRVTAPAYEALRRHLAAVSSVFEAFEAFLTAEEQSGRLTWEEGMQRRTEEWKRLSKPFKDKQDAVAKAQSPALEVYREQMSAAFDAYALAGENQYSAPALASGESSQPQVQVGRSCTISGADFSCRTL